MNKSQHNMGLNISEHIIRVKQDALFRKVALHIFEDALQHIAELGFAVRYEGARSEEDLHEDNIILVKRYDTEAS